MRPSITAASLIALIALTAPGAIAPADTSDSAFEALMTRLRAHPRILPVTVHVSRFQ
jgi:hypothetical protein